jgi:hypothetical protein
MIIKCNIKIIGFLVLLFLIASCSKSNFETLDLKGCWTVDSISVYNKDSLIDVVKTEFFFELTENKVFFCGTSEEEASVYVLNNWGVGKDLYLVSMKTNTIESEFSKVDRSF